MDASVSLMKLSRFATKFTTGSGIVSLMDDMGAALAEGDMLMLGGGNPGRIPQVEARFRERMQQILDTPGEFERLIGNYGPPAGDKSFREALGALLHQTYGWPIDERNIALTNGSQSAFFMLFNLFAGECAEPSFRKILLPITPEYIGYGDAGLSDDLFVSARPRIELLDEHSFKYRVDFDSLTMNDEIGAVCVSRPTNPTGNVLTDNEITKLLEMCQNQDIPLIIDGAYGTPFPHLLFTDVEPFWNTQTIICLSLSKLGLPGMRTGIIIADEWIIEALAGINAIVNLATGGAGAALAMDMVKSGDILDLSRDVIRPFYEQRAAQAIDTLNRALRGTDFYVHKPEGAMFLWLWLKGLPITCQTLYERLKQRGVLVIAGHHFFPGLKAGWDHADECIRITYSQDWASVEKGLHIIADEVKRAYAEG